MILRGTVRVEAAILAVLAAGIGQAPSQAQAASQELTAPTDVTVEAAPGPVGTSIGQRGERAAQASQDPVGSLWSWPVPERAEPLRAFDPPASRWGAGHRGVDLSAQAGDPIRAVRAGVVSYSGTIAGTGVVAIVHDQGPKSTYQPIEGGPEVGTRVQAGEVIGGLGDGHCGSASCLHLGARNDVAAYQDPMSLLGAGELALLPHAAAELAAWAGFGE